MVRLIRAVTYLLIFLIMGLIFCASLYYHIHSLRIENMMQTKSTKPTMTREVSMEGSLICLTTSGNRKKCLEKGQFSKIVEELQRNQAETDEVQIFSVDAGIMDPHEDIISELRRSQNTFQMRSDSNETDMQEGFDAGLTDECLHRSYGDFSDWPKASVILPFCNNELLVDVLHTVHSIIQRSPEELLQEVILIADNVKKDDFKEVLDNYCNSVFGNKVRIIRSEETLGLIRGRLLGARQARGDVIITMDAHMEVQETWLEALIYEIRQNRKTMATAMLDWMKPPIKDGDSWKYEKGLNGFICVFSWDLGFGFSYPRPQIDAARHGNPMGGIPAPCSVGTIWAMDKKFFTEIGELDEGMELWGGENLDLPIRVWLFGGRAVQVPCSHAAHLERPHQRDYRYGWDKFIKRNYRRVVDVWFDDYKKHVYRQIPEMLDVDPGNLTSRLELKKKAVHEFKWFLQNIYPELGLYDNDTFGYDWLKNTGIHKCLHMFGEPPIRTWECLGQPVKEGLWLTTDGYLRTDTKIWHVGGSNKKAGSKLNSEGVSGTYNAKWLVKWIHWKNGPMMLYEEENNKGAASNLCLEAFKNMETRLEVLPCDPEKPNQRWQFKIYTPDYKEFMTKGTNSRFNSVYHKTLLAKKQEWDSFSSLDDNSLPIVVGRSGDIAYSP